MCVEFSFHLRLAPHSGTFRKQALKFRSNNVKLLRKILDKMRFSYRITALPGSSMRVNSTSLLTQPRDTSKRMLPDLISSVY